MFVNKYESFSDVPYLKFQSELRAVYCGNRTPTKTLCLFLPMFQVWNISNPLVPEVERMGARGNHLRGIP
jgi:hypothetical protein